MSLSLIIIAVVGLALSGLPSLVLGARSAAGAIAGAILNVAAAVAAFAGLALFLQHPAATIEWSCAWGIPLGRFAVGLDALSALFLVPIFLIAALGSVYGLSYWSPRHHPGNGQRLRICWGLLAGALAMVVLARDAIVFLMAWEIMALCAFMLVATEDHKSEVRRAAWVYLIATHFGTLSLFGLFALLRIGTDSYALWPQAIPANVEIPLLILGLAGFGMKAGIFPLHIWLPGAHANAPSHVSAVLSGVMLKMGIYGLFRITLMAAQPPVWWGALVLGLGTLSALVGIAYAAGQKDYKRLLAYSSIENIGIIAMGLGLALLGRSSGHREWVVLGIGASLFHVLNHSLFKPMLFMGAGSLLHAVHTRSMDRLGGLAKRMPLTFGLFVLGAIAICGLPPLNGFVSELLLYIGLLKTAQAPSTAPGTAWGWAALAVPALAAVGAMAVAAFVRLLGSVFQGEPRRTGLVHPHDPPATMWLPLALLALACVTIGFYPALVLPLLDPAVRGWAGPAAQRIGSLVPLEWPGWAAVALLAGVAMTGALLAMLSGRRSQKKMGTWDCGYARPTSRMQYTGASFAQNLLDLTAWALWPRGGRLRLRRLFPRAAFFSRQLPDVVLDRALVPAFDAARRAATLVHGFQQGSVQAYLVYVLVILIVLSVL